jgi:nucleotide-binding universal stress UspA family protein
VPLVAVWAWEFSPLVVMTDAPIEIEELRAGVEERLQAVLTDELGEDAASRVDARAVEDAPVRALIETASEDDLVVVGSRGHGGFKAALLGSVSQQVVHYAVCPVTVVRADAEHR